MRRSDDSYGVSSENICNESIFYDTLTRLESRDDGRTKRGLFSPIEVDLVSIILYSSSDSLKFSFVENIVTEVWENHRIDNDKEIAWQYK